jgi:hypothetical protein
MQKSRCPRCGERHLRPGLKRCPVCFAFCLETADDPPIAEEWWVWFQKAWRHMSTFGMKIILNRDACEPWQPHGLDEDSVDAKTL